MPAKGATMIGMRIIREKLLTLFISGVLGFTFRAEANPLPRLNGDGTPEADGSRPSSYGQNASPSTPGTDAEHIEIHLSVPQTGRGQTRAGQVIVRAQFTDPTVRRSVRRQNVTATIGTAGYIAVDARGGRGGDGGHGARGRDGRAGRDGSDATRYSSGTNGEHGEDGSPGGDGTPGSNGGRGGNVSIRVGAEDTHLLMLVHYDNSGGAGGAEGQNGPGGSGGSGGRGGSSHSWTTYRTEHYTDTEYSTDANGNSTTTTVRKTRDIPEFHHNPGGRDGRDGSDGRSGRGRIDAGRSGAPGTFTIIVEDSNQRQRTYSQVYGLKVENFQLAEGSRNGILEPGEQVTVSQIRVKNTGGMPTPPNHPIELFLENSRWAVSRPIRVLIPRSLRPGESLTLSESLQFDIPNHTVAEVGPRFTAEGQITAAAWLPAVERVFTEGPRTTRTEITFPVEVEPIEGWNTLLPGQVTSVRWRIRNISGRDIGSAADLRRLLENRLMQIQTEGRAPRLTFFDESGSASPDAAGLLAQITNLRAGETREVRGFVGVIPQEGIGHYTGSIQLQLNLGSPLAPDVTRVVQRREHRIQVAEPYRRNPGRNILLITNHNTTNEQVEAWRQTATTLGQGLDTMNLSFEGRIDFEMLLRDFNWRTVVILNDEMTIPSRGSANPQSFIAKSQLLQMLADEGIRVMVVGGTRPSGETQDQSSNEALLRSLLIPTSSGRETQMAESAAAFRRSTLGRERTGQVADHESNSTTVMPNQGVDHEIPVYRTYLFGPASQERRNAAMAREARRIQEQVSRNRPDARFLVFHETFDKAREAQGTRARGGSDAPLLGSQYQIGRIIVSETLTQQRHGALFVETPENQIHSTTYIQGQQNRFSLALALQIEDKVTAFNQFLAGTLPLPQGADRQAIGEAFVQAILTDLAAEQRGLVAGTRNHGFTPEMLRSLLDTLDYVTRTVEFHSHELNTPEGRAFIDLVARLRRMTSDQVRYWHYLLPGMRSRHLARIAAPMIQRMVDAAFGRAGTPLHQAGRVALQTRERELRATGNHASQSVTQRLSEHGIVSDQSVFQSPAGRTLPKSDRVEAIGADRSRENLRTQNELQIQEARREFVQTWGCDATGCATYPLENRTGVRVASATAEEPQPRQEEAEIHSVSEAAPCETLATKARSLRGENP